MDCSVQVWCSLRGFVAAVRRELSNFGGSANGDDLAVDVAVDACAVAGVVDLDSLAEAAGEPDDQDETVVARGDGAADDGALNGDGPRRGIRLTVLGSHPPSVSGGAATNRFRPRASCVAFLANRTRADAESAAGRRESDEEPTDARGP